MNISQDKGQGPQIKRPDKQEVKILMDHQRRLYINHPDGVQYLLEIFDGGGYVVQLWPRTQEEINEANRKWVQREKARDEMREIQNKLDKKKWYEFWK